MLIAIFNEDYNMLDYMLNKLDYLWGLAELETILAEIQNVPEAVVPVMLDFIMSSCTFKIVLLNSPFTAQIDLIGKIINGELFLIADLKVQFVIHKELCSTKLCNAYLVVKL